MIKKTILIVEDDQGIQEVMKTILIDSGYTPIIVDNARDMFGAIHSDKPVMLFLDVSLAGENGAIIADQLKKKKDTKDIPIIMMSAHSDIQAIARAAKADGILRKPFDISELLALIDKYLQ